MKRKYVPYETVGEFSYKKRLDGGENMQDVISNFVSDFLQEYARMNGTQTQKDLITFLKKTHRIARSLAYNSNDCFVKTFKLVPNWMQIFIAQLCIFGAQQDEKEKSTERIKSSI